MDSIKIHNIKQTKMEKQEEILNDQIGGTLNTTKTEELIKREWIDGTPFTLITTEGKCFATLGKYKLTEDYPEDARDVLESMIYDMEWNFIMNVINALIIDNNQQQAK